jgi:hypothetical protein
MRTDVFSRAARLTAATGLALAVSSVGLATAAGATAARATRKVVEAGQRCGLGNDG